MNKTSILADTGSDIAQAGAALERPARSPASRAKSNAGDEEDD